MIQKRFNPYSGLQNVRSILELTEEQSFYIEDNGEIFRRKQNGVQDRRST